MSVHPSLKVHGDVATKRNVLKRFERIDILKKRGKIKEDDHKVWGLPKTRVDE